MSIPNRIQSSAIDILAASLIAALVVVTPAPLCAQQSTAPQKAAAKAVAQSEEENEAPTAQKPGSEGIKVHGHWIIDVKDKDGKLVEHRDFHNSLTASYGPNTLILTLAGARVYNSFTINLFDSQSKTYVLFPAPASGTAPLGAHTCTTAAPTCNPNLTTTLHQDSSGRFDSIILAGSFTPTTAISLTNVGTLANACTTQDNTLLTLSAAQCAAYTNYSASGNITMGDFNFTNTILATPLSVAAGQSVSVSVTLSFS